MENQTKRYLFTYALNHSTYALNVYTIWETEKSVNFHLFWLFSRSTLTLIFFILFQTKGKTKIRIVNDQQKWSGKSTNFNRLEFLIRLMFCLIRVEMRKFPKAIGDTQESILIHFTSFFLVKRVGCCNIAALYLKSVILAFCFSL